ncbi:sterol glucosyltransferase [Hypoxylon argillaceum]|nr:sterol glucosyltransferase [Hypoxylon argillaceum]
MASSSRQSLSGSDVEVDEPPPSYESSLNAGFLQGSTRTTDDGRVDVDPESRFFKTLSRLVPDVKVHPRDSRVEPPAYTSLQASHSAIPKDARGKWTGQLNIVIQVVGSRGDVQPFVALGTELQRDGHRVRIATHDVFERFVRDAGLGFHPIGGDPSELMAYMVKNPGLIPSMASLRAGDIQKKRRMVARMLEGCWQACIAPDARTGAPFVADAIIANPPSFAHIHCAQALGIPLHLMFTMPWTSTRVFSHPLANMKTKTENQGTANFVSFSIVEWMTWQGLGDIINDWRNSIDLEPVPLTEGPNLAETLKIPFTYCWSPSLIPKPFDWPEHIDVCGFFFREPPQYTPSDELREFLKRGPPPVYIGFGSIVVDNPAELTRIILEATRAVGVRALISRGWSNLGNADDADDHVMYLDDCPHEWLFQHVSAVVHHGGAGTTACGLRYGCPTTVVPFFGDQPFWGTMIAAAGAGPEPIPHKSLTRDNLAEALQFCLREEVATAARCIAMNMSHEDGVKRAVNSFYTNLPTQSLFCDILKDRPAVWEFRRKGRRYKLSGVAGEVLIRYFQLDRRALKLYKCNEIIIENRRWDPVSGTVSAAISTFSSMAHSTANIFVKPIQIQRAKNHSDLQRSREITTSTSDHSFDEPEDHNEAKSAGKAVLPPRRSESSPTPRAHSPARSANPGLSMALASAAGVGGFFKHYTKGVFIDIPVAFAEGARAVPRLYGDDVADYGTVKDWKSGFLVSGKNLTLGLGEGFADLVVKPYEGGRDGGAVGGIKGAGKGLVSFVTKTSSAAVGVAGYPALGIYKSIRSSVRDGTRNAIALRRFDEAVWTVDKIENLDGVAGKVLDAFNVLIHG